MIVLAGAPAIVGTTFLWSMFTLFIYLCFFRGYRPWGGRPLLRCSACGDRLTRNVPKRWWWAGVALWIAFAEWALYPLPDDWQPWIAITIAIPWNMAETRIYQWWWMRRHPTRCQGGGLPEPVTA